MILSLDTCLQQCSVALVGDGQQYFECVEMQQGHASHLAPMVQGIMRRGNVTLGDISAIGVTIGPGGFTGLRVGLSFARAFVIGTEIPVIGITTLEVLAASAVSQIRHIKSDIKIASLIDARRKKLYAQVFHLGQDGRINAITDAADMDYTDAAALITEHQPPYIAGNGAALLSDVDDAQTICTQIDPIAIAQMTQNRLDGMADMSNMPKPTALYLRDADATPAKPILSFEANITQDKEA